MGRSRRDQPIKLPRKLREIRLLLGLTQEQMAAQLRRSSRSRPRPGHVSEYEHGKRQPSVVMLLKYARMVGVPMEVLVDDDMELPRKLE
jgi:transcriptional regulator with XRE-family HTH domain